MATKKGKEEGKVKKEGTMKKGKVEEKEVKGFEFAEDDLVEAIEALNEVLDEPMEAYEGKGKKKVLRDQDDLVEEFKEAVEGLEEEDVPELALSFYKGLTEEEPEEEEPEEEEPEEEEPEEGPIAEDDLVAAIEALNESDLASEKVVVYEGKGKNKAMRDIDTLIGDFMTACETVSEEDEDSLPEETVEAYNALSDYMKEKAKAEAKAKKDKKADKADKKADKADKKVDKKDKGKDPAKVARGKALAASRKENKGPSMIDITKKMILDGATDKEFQKAFSKIYAEKGRGEDKEFIQSRIVTYKKIAQKEIDSEKGVKKASKKK